ncbi:MAG: site-specific integrase [Methanobrevibacter sp.]|nr:site-specific integrase [Methanobrevibacter sp.]
MKHTGKDLQELIKEADEEEMQGIRWKDRKLRSYLISYRANLHNNVGLAENTVNKYLQLVKTFYYHYGIEIGKLPSYTSKSVRKNEPITADDIPTKEDIKLSIDLSTNSVMRALIHFMSSTGLAIVDALSLTVEDFVEACEDYYASNNLNEIINILSVSEDVIPTFKLRRRKTGKFFYTFATSEAVNSVAVYLKTRKDLSLRDKLFKITKNYCFILFREINVAMGKKKKNSFSLFRSHMLRKFQAKQLYDDGMSVEDIDAIQGRSKDRTHEAYFIIDPDKLKKRYIEHMGALCLFNEVEVRTIESEEFKELKKINNEYRTKLEEQEDMIRQITENQKNIREMLDL